MLEHGCSVAGYHIEDGGAVCARCCDKTPPLVRTRAISGGCPDSQGCPGDLRRRTVLAARMNDWVETTSIGTFKSDDLTRPGSVFRYNRYLYRTLGKHL